MVFEGSPHENDDEVGDDDGWHSPDLMAFEGSPDDKNDDEVGDDDGWHSPDLMAFDLNFCG
jgi:hypothetical protein